MLRIAVLVSGGGTNLQAIMDAVADGEITNTEIATVISNNKNAYALERAAKAGIPNCCISPKDYADRAQFHEALLAALDEAQVDLIVLAGFLVVIPEMMIRKIQKPHHQHPSVSDSVILRNRILWFESTRRCIESWSESDRGNLSFCR